MSEATQVGAPKTPVHLWVVGVIEFPVPDYDPGRALCERLAADRLIQLLTAYRRQVTWAIHQLTVLAALNTRPEWRTCLLGALARWQHFGRRRRRRPAIL